MNLVLPSSGSGEKTYFATEPLTNNSSQFGLSLAKKSKLIGKLAVKLKKNAGTNNLWTLSNLINDNKYWLRSKINQIVIMDLHLSSKQSFLNPKLINKTEKKWQWILTQHQSSALEGIRVNIKQICFGNGHTKKLLLV